MPEVETIRLGLQRYIVGKTIEDVEVRLHKMLTGNPKDIIGAKVIDVRRFGKGLVIDLNNGYSIAAHIKLTGQFTYRDSLTSNIKLSPKVGLVLPNKFTHVIFKLKSQISNLKSTSQISKLYYNDLRQFGWIKIVKTDEIQKLPFFKELGPEPPVLDYSSSDRVRRGSREVSSRQARTILTLELFKQILSRSNLAIKVLIMDQKKMSGVGNIYANDALFEARIDPRRSAKQITPEETKKLFNSILKVLKKGLENGGASELSYVNVLGQEGGYQKHFLVYGREKESCKVCKTPIKKIKLGGRGTYFCPECQK